MYTKPVSFKKIMPR